MTLFYSQSTKAFYDTVFAYGSLPDDIIAISPAEHQTLLDGINNNNKDIIVDDEGKLQLVDRPVVIVLPTWNFIRRERNHLLASTDYTQVADWPGDKVMWATYRQALRDIPQSYDSPEDVIWPSIPGE
jgi:hypothetical protein